MGKQSKPCTAKMENSMWLAIVVDHKCIVSGANSTLKIYSLCLEIGNEGGLNVEGSTCIGSIQHI